MEMAWSLRFVLNNIFLGAGLAMDAFSVSLVNGLGEPGMSKKKMCAIAGVFAFFQAMMPMIGWICVHTVLQYFQAFEMLIPWIALAMLLFIGGKMLLEGIRNQEETAEKSAVSINTLLIQGIATSIDALSVGFTIAGYGLAMAVVSALLISIVTFVICICGLLIGRRFGTKLSDKAAILGGVILIAIGIEIFVS
jgi:Predicted membrane protein